MKTNKKIAIITSSFNSNITVNLYDGAINTLISNDVPSENIKSIWVPGALEIPYASSKLANQNKIDGIIALGAIIKGDTDHNKLVAENAYRGCMDVSIKSNLPITLGIISADNIELAKSRSHDIKAEITNPDIKQPVNYGVSAAKALLDVFKLDI
ncbi:MAG: 6,7-dimethyl-8-ribityllumazine synthase [Chloroflexi bacterium]|nr:6,7-dimethyl-8-ribityllumazine synthase [Chloroflexota bacterium]|tara:strand:+ start:2201 stop:2665 length:465 start_codon:yes stop_codon:yes gene_type:complete